MQNFNGATLMQKYLVEKLRELSKVKGKMQPWTAQLTDQQLWELFLRLRNGESAKSIARYVQTWGMLPESTTHSLSQGVLKFKKRISHLLLTPPLQDADLSADDTEPLDTLEEIERITRLQADRINKMMAEERETGVRYSNLSKELQSLSALTKSLIKAKDFSMRHEGMDPIETKRRERMERRIDRRFKNLMSGMSEDGKSAMVEAADRFLQLCEEDALILHVDKDGRKRLVKPGENIPQ